MIIVVVVLADQFRLICFVKEFVRVGQVGRYLGLVGIFYTFIFFIVSGRGLFVFVGIESYYLVAVELIYCKLC